MAEIHALALMTCTIIVVAYGANNRFNQDWWYNDGRGAGYETWGPENEGRLNREWWKDMAKIEERLARLEEEFNHRLMYASNYRPIDNPKYFLGQSGSVAARNSDSQYSETPFRSEKDSLGKESSEYPHPQNKVTAHQDPLEDESARNKPPHTLEELRTMDEKQSKTASNLKGYSLHVPSVRSENNPTDRDCDSIYGRRMTWDGVYNVIIGGKIVEVYCDFQNNGHNWLVIQRRSVGKVDFYRDWEDYKKGFGDPSGEFWIGLENLHQITTSRGYVLRIELEDWDGNFAYAEYKTFTVGDEQSNYQLAISGFSGTGGDALAYHNGHPFSTRDRPHDRLRNINCAVESHGGWWYNACQRSNLNGKYIRKGASAIDGICWYYWKKSQYSMRRVEMKIRRV